MNTLRSWRSWLSWTFRFLDSASGSSHCDGPGISVSIRCRNSLSRAYLQYFFTFNVGNPAAVTEEELAEYVRAYSEPGALRAGFAYYRALSEDVKRNEGYARTRLPMPVLALGGALTMGEGMLRQLQPVADKVQGGVLSTVWPLVRD
jgi:hypothetical protein